MSLLKKKKIEDDKSFSESQITQLSELVSSTFNDTSNISSNDAEKLESIKIILASILNDSNLESLTNLTEEEISDINDAFYLYHYYQNPLIMIFIEHRLKLARSVIYEKPKNLLSIFSDIANKSNGYNENGENRSILGKLRGK